MTAAPASPSADLSPLTDAETTTARGMLSARTRLAHQFSALAAVPAGLFVMRTALRAWRVGRLDEPLVLVAGLGVLAVLGWIVWHFGWRLVSDMKADLSAGQKRLVRGAITAVDSQRNAHGETITHVTIEGLKMVSRAPEVAAWKPGQRAVVECLPRSKVVFRGQLDAPTP